MLSLDKELLLIAYLNWNILINCGHCECDIDINRFQF